MKKLALALLGLVPLYLFAQKRDYVWLAGDDNTLGDTAYGGITIDFNQKPRSVSYQYREVNLFTQNASVCDTAGNLLLYTNGCAILDSNNELIVGGEEINPGYMYNKRCIEFEDGYGGGYPSAVFLPLPEKDSTYYLFNLHSTYEPGPPQDLYNDALLISRVSIRNDGIPQVLFKSKPIIEDALAFGEMSAVKHANGTDWWVITPRRNSNEFYSFLFTKDGIVDTLLQTIGDPAPAEEEGSGQTTFSHDGSTMARYYSYHDVMMYDFDRATGQFSNYRTIPIDFGNTLAFDGGCAFSPSGRFLYIFALLKVYQFDLWASNIGATQTTVGEWDGFKDPIATVFAWAQLGPDCKIYSQCGDMRYYHIVHNPDAPGLACNFEQRGLVLPTPSGASIPYFPNYRLGPVGNPGVPCSPTVSVGGEPVREAGGVRVWPNPASDRITVEYNLTADTDHSILLINALGQVVSTVSLFGQMGRAQIPVAQLPAGVYWYAVPGAVISTGKFIINR